MKVAIVSDSMSFYGGAERVLEQMFAVYPEADLFATLNVLPANQLDFLGDRRVQTSFLQRLPMVQHYHRYIFPLWGLAVEQLDVSAYDLVISTHHSVAQGVITRPFQTHVSYVHSPMRYAWDLQDQYLRQSRVIRGPLAWWARRVLHQVRLWDYAAAQRPDAIAVNSSFVRERVRKYYRRDARVIHPPVAVESFQPAETKDEPYYLSLCRLVSYKRVELLAQAFSRMPGRKLKIVGTGPELNILRRYASENVEVLGWQPAGAVRDLVAKASALVFGGVEDFGISLVEAQAAGVPVIAFGQGGARETVRTADKAHPTGVLFREQTPESVVGAIAEFERNRDLFTPRNCRANAEAFSEDRFRRQFADFVESALVHEHVPAEVSSPAPRRSQLLQAI
ncbi:Glycosyltransferase involved in cell wall bisynthesis [Faunimonas pinastri]|uniref:Glycosyltransferase involved in cell wall bisynthesis n=1 Tax=Faunimonas pinastri TaxID=1855383 RepID=A0A1H9PHC7_9HYPH|nr:glycosyltransferase [Faunimonas pinastri]SER47554.1 Glycosyltransferase involved in cell wall bisynthesis [Faunimonas pinastri]